jgi:hypothetical protein
MTEIGVQSIINRSGYRRIYIWTKCSLCGNEKWTLRYSFQNSKTGLCKECVSASLRRKIEDRFWEKVDKSNNCWNWIGAITRDGYGAFQVTSKKTIRAHRLSFEMSKGMIPVGLVLDHICNNKKCVNPEHLRAVTNWENIKRSNAICSVNARVTHCPKGHPYDDVNTYHLPKGGRGCKACRLQVRIKNRRMKHEII